MATTEVKPDLDSIKRLTRDLAQASLTLSDAEARFLVDSYYLMQENRIRAAAQVRELNKTEEPHAILDWLFTQSEVLESQIRRSLDRWSGSKEIGVWLKSITGIGPVLAAGLMAHIDIEKAPTAGHIWSFAGLNPETKWEKNTRRPWNANLKVLCWKIGESFIKVSGNPNDVYGKIYFERKLFEQKRNDSGANAAIAKEKLELKRFKKDTVSYKRYSEGFLPDIQIHRRSSRYAVKLFLAHFHEVYYWLTFHKMPPMPYAMAYLEHAHKIDPPNTDMLEGWPGAQSYTPRKFD
jgi:hypothetical protein